MHLEIGWVGRTCLIAAAAVVLVLLVATAAGAASPRLTRYPYLTDVVATGGAVTATINWATDQSQATAYATYGAAGTESATSHRVTATRTSISVNGVPEYQWMARISGLTPGVVYAYRTFLGDPGVDLLSGEADLRFRTPSADPSSTFSFAVMGDWGANSSGANPDQANLDAQVAASGASFVLSTGDVANPAGSQANYGDLQQTGPDLSNVFGPAFYKAIGGGMPLFGAPGNHGFNSTFLDIWPEATGPSSSSGRYQMDTYSLPGTNTASYPSVWYAFSVGSARFYILTAAWANSNVGSGTLYSNDRAAHWTPTSPEYQWLANDLATHPAAVKFAVFHFPMYTDNATEATDTYLHGPDSLAELLGRYGVQFVFNGHAHIYERNLPQPGEGFVSYVVGGGGSLLEPVSLRGAFDAYAIGWSPTNNTGSARGSAPVPTSPAQVYSFLLVTVSPGQVKVNPIDSLGRSFDLQTFPISGTVPAQDTTPPTTSASGVAAGAWLRGPSVVHLTATDGSGSGVASITYSHDGGAPVVVPGSTLDVSVIGEGRHELDYWARDLAGNEEAGHSLSFGIDTVAPSSSASGVGPGTWLRGPAAVHLAASDGAASGVASISYSLDGATPVVAPGSSVDVSVSGNGRHQLVYWARDVAGNEEAHKSLSFGIDTVPPSTSAAGVTAGGWLQGTAVHLDASDDAGSGVASITYSLDGAAAVSTSLSSVDVSVSGDGRHELTYWARDVAGNEEPHHSMSFGVDAHAPVTSAAGVTSGSWSRGPALVHLTATDAGSGVASISYAVDGGAVIAASGSSVDISVTGEGRHRLAYWARDVAGNEEVHNSLSFSIDTGAPTSSADGVTTGGWLQGHSVHLAASDGAGSGVASISYSVDGATQVIAPVSSVDVPIIGDGRHALTYWAQDLAGNEEAHKSLSFSIDTRAPSVSATGAVAGGWLRGNAVIHLVAADQAGSGMASVSYSLDGAGAVLTQGAFVDVSVTRDGRHQLTYWGRDLAGNEESHQSLEFGTDGQAPATSVNADDRWHRSPVTLSFTATDRWSGVQKTEFQVDGGDWQSDQPLVPLVIAAPADHSWDGVHTILFRSVDVAGNVETVRAASVRVDTRRPTTSTLRAASVRRWRTATLFYRVDDGQPTSGRARVEIRIRTKSGRLVKLLTIGWKTVNRDTSSSFRCTLPRGAYRFQVYATDFAGNRQEKAGANRLLVK